MAAHSSILAWKIPWTEEPGYSPWGHREFHASGEGERLIALEPWQGAGDQPRLIQGIRRRDGVGEDQETTA